MDRNSSHPLVNLPTRTRKDLVGAARAGARDAVDLEEHLLKKQLAEALTNRPAILPSQPDADRHRTSERDGVPVIEISRKEHALLVEIAVFAETFFPRLELTGAPVERPREWNLMRERLTTFRKMVSGNNKTAASTDAILGLLEAERLLAD